MEDGHHLDPFETPMPHLPAPPGEPGASPVEIGAPDGADEEAWFRAQPTATLVLAYWQTHCCIKNTVALGIPSDGDVLFRHMRRLDLLNALLRERFRVH